MVLSILSLPLFVGLPFLTGEGFLYIVKALSKKSVDFDNYVNRFTFYWLAGNLILLAFSLFLLSIAQFSIILVFLLSLVLAIFSILDDTQKPVNWNLAAFENYGGLYHAMFAVVLGMVPAIYFATFLPYPQQYNTILPIHNRVILDILNNNLFSSPAFSFSYTIMPYLPLSLLTLAGNIPSYSVFWVMPLAFYPIFNLGIFLLTYQLTRNKWFSLLACFFAPWVMTYEGLFQENYSITPRAYLYMLFPYILYYLRSLVRNKNVSCAKIATASVGILVCTASFMLPMFFISSSVNIGFLMWQIVAVGMLFLLLALSYFMTKGTTRWLFTNIFFLSLSLFAFHSYEALLYLSVASFFVFLERALEEHEKAFTLSLIMVACCVSILVLRYLNLVTLPQLQISPFITGRTYDVASVQQVLSDFTRANTLYIVLLFLIGLLLLIPKMNPLDVSIMTLCVLIISLYTFPDSMAVRIGSTIAPFFVYVVSRFLFSVINLKPSSIGQKSFFKSRKFKIYKTLAVISILTPIIVIPIQQNHHIYYVTDYEYAAVSRLNSMLNRSAQLDTFVLSDPWTMTVFSGLTYVESPTPRVYLWSEYSEQAKQIIDYIQTQIFQALTSDRVAYAIWEFKNFSVQKSKLDEGIVPLKNNSKLILVIEGRTLQWMESAEPFTYQATDISPEENVKLSPFLDQRYFETIFKVDHKIYVFSVNLPKGW
jgi:hypothetical protein